MEAAAYCVSKVNSVIVVGRGSVPFQPILGEKAGARILQLFEEKGVKFRMGCDVTSFVGESKVNEVKLSTGEVLPADVVILGIGAQPSTAFLQGTDIEMQRGAIVVNKVIIAFIPSTLNYWSWLLNPILPFAVHGKQHSRHICCR